MSKEEGIDPAMQALLSYLSTGEPSDDLTSRIQNRVRAARDKEEWKMIYLKQHSRDETIRREAEAVGESRGRKEGRKEEAETIARSMRERDMDTALIVELTDLSEEEISLL